MKRTLWIVLGLMIVGVAFGQSKRSSMLTRPTHANLVYQQAGNLSLKLDLYLPKEKLASGEKWPIVVWVHGGGWVMGGKYPCVMSYLTKHGYAVASVQYRFAQQAKFPAQISDCRDAVRWLKANAGKYQLDDNRIAVAGESAGGHLVALLGMTADQKKMDDPKLKHLKQSPQVQAVVDIFGPTDLPNYAKDLGQLKLNGNPRNPIALLLGGSVEKNMEIARQASPITHVKKDAPPFLIIHGDRDRLVPIQQSRSLNQKLKKHGVESTLRVIKGAGHGPSLYRRDRQFYQSIKKFIDKHLKENTKITPSKMQKKQASTNPPKNIFDFEQTTYTHTQ